jgi:hypothetical protein
MDREYRAESPGDGGEQKSNCGVGCTLLGARLNHQAGSSSELSSDRATAKNKKEERSRTECGRTRGLQGPQ